MREKKPNIGFIVFIAVSFIVLALGVIFFIMRLNEPTPTSVSTTTVSKMVPTFSLPLLTIPPTKSINQSLDTDSTNAKSSTDNTSQLDNTEPSDSTEQADNTDQATKTQLITNADLPKEPYLLNVWATWCIACSREHPLLLKLQQQGVNIVGVSYKDDKEYTIKYLKEEGNPYSILIEDEEGNLGVDLGLTGAPESFVIDPKGVIRQHITGEINQDRWKNRIQPCLLALKNTDSLSNEASKDKQQSVCQ